MNQARAITSTAGRVILLTSLLFLVLVLALWIAGPALVFAIFSAVLVLSPLVPIPRAPAAVRLAARRRQSPPRAPPVF
jgi:O-antigen ligase